MTDKEKKKRVVTREAPGTWDVKYKWHFRSDYMDKYVAGLKDKKMLATKCPQCGRVFSPPTTRCGRCFIEISDWTEVKDTGRVIMYTAAFNAISGEPLPEPKITAIVQLDGSDAWMIAPVKETRPEDMKTGMRVHIVWNPERSGKLKDIMHFKGTVE
jgi:uncharacterized protein